MLHQVRYCCSLLNYLYLLTRKSTITYKDWPFWRIYKALQQLLKKADKPVQRLQKCIIKCGNCKKWYIMPRSQDIGWCRSWDNQCLTITNRSCILSIVYQLMIKNLCFYSDRGLILTCSLSSEHPKVTYTNYMSASKTFCLNRRKLLPGSLSD